MPRTESSEFWRRGFWIRPALFVLASLGAVVVGVLFFAEARDASAATRAVAADRICGASSELSCVEREPGYLSGPEDRWRSSNEGWQLHREEGFVASFEVSSGVSSDLERIGDSAVFGLVYKGEVIAIADATGSQVPTVLGGTGAVIFALCAGLSAIGLALALLVIGVANTPLLDQLPLLQRSLGPLLAVGAFLAAVPFMWVLPMLRGFDWEVGGIVAACTGAVVIWFCSVTLRETSGGRIRPWHGGRHSKTKL